MKGMSYIMATRVPKVITNKNDIDYLLNLKEEDITLSKVTTVSRSYGLTSFCGCMIPRFSAMSIIL